MEKTHQTSAQKDEALEKELGLGTFFIIATFVFIIWGLFWYLVNDMKERGTFGDMFGAINALFSGIALAGIIYTMLLQRQELKYQREELIKNREELQRTAQAQENQVETQKISAKLNAMSTLINYHLSNISRMPNWPHGNDEMKVNAYKKEIEEILEKEF